MVSLQNHHSKRALKQKHTLPLAVWIAKQKAPSIGGPLPVGPGGPSFSPQLTAENQLGKWKRNNGDLPLCMYKYGFFYRPLLIMAASLASNSTTGVSCFMLVLLLKCRKDDLCSDTGVSQNWIRTDSLR